MNLNKSRERQGENDTWSLVTFAYITANIALISNTSDNWILTEQNLVGAIFFKGECSSANEL